MRRPKCPDCGNPLDSGYLLGFAGLRFWCVENWTKCPASKTNKLWTLEEIKQFEIKQKQKVSNEMIKCIYKYTHNKSIVELKFQTTPRKGAWKENIQPVIEILKATIPSSNRAYDPSSHKWEIAIEYWEPYRALIKQLGGTFQEEQEVKSAEIPNIHVPEDYAANFFHEQIPEQREEDRKEYLAEKLSEFLGVKVVAQDLSELRTLYRQKARQLHPDLGGDAAKMSELNRLWTLYTAQDRVVN